jgi:hypothetical protein
LDVNVLNAFLGQLWPMFDRDGSGTVEEAEFLAPGGLCETIVAQLPRTVQYPNYSSPYPQHQPPQQQQAPAAGPPAGAVSMNCWSCRNAATVQPPPGESTVSICCYKQLVICILTFYCSPLYNRYPKFHRDVPLLQPAKPNQHLMRQTEVYMYV